jgi:hypothetical protein
MKEIIDDLGLEVSGGNQTSNQNAGRGWQQQQHGNQSSSRPLEQVAQNATGGNETGITNTSAFTGGGGMTPETKRWYNQPSFLLTYR